MPVRAANVSDSVIYRATSGDTRSMVVLAKQSAAPPQPTPSTSTTGGTLAAATYSYRLSKVVLGIESLAAAAVTQVTTGATSTVTLDWSATVDPRASSYKVYGRTGGTELLMGTVSAGTTNFVDTGAVTPSGALPAANTNISVLDPYGAPRTNIAKATTYKATNVYFLR